MNTELDFVSHIVTTITGASDCFDVEKSLDERGVLITLAVDKDHLGRVIGKNGSTAQSIRNLLRALGMENDARYSLLINERDIGDEVKNEQL